LAPPHWNFTIIKESTVKKNIVRIAIDGLMTIFLLLAYAYQITDHTAHEWIGLAFVVLCITHIVINKHWYKNIFKGKYNLLRIIQAAINILLLAVIAVLLVSGLLLSRSVLSFLNLPGDLLYRQIHTTAAYWLYIIVSIHIALYWNRVLYTMKKLTGIERENQIRIIIMRLLVFMIAIFGIWSFIDRDMFAKLFLGFSFDYWDASRPTILFFVQTLSIIVLFTFSTFYFLKLIAWIKNK
jgi:hypothetical protein